MDLFVYGTLMDADVWSCVCGGPVGKAEAASIRGYKRVPVLGRTYPILRPHTGGLVDGILRRAVPPAAMERLCAYEGPDYDLVTSRIVVAFGPTVSAAVFLPKASVQHDPRPWRLDDWQRRHKREFMRSLHADGKPT